MDKKRANHNAKLQLNHYKRLHDKLRKRYKQHRTILRTRRQREQHCSTTRFLYGDEPEGLSLCDYDSASQLYEVTEDLIYSLCDAKNAYYERKRYIEAVKRTGDWNTIDFYPPDYEYYSSESECYSSIEESL